MVGWCVREIVDCEVSVDVNGVCSPAADVHLVSNLHLAELAIVGSTVIDKAHGGAVLFTVDDASGLELEEVERVGLFKFRSMV